jgi:dTDP-4-amino-4,6-dideoxygalactose transaminase
VGSLGDAGCLSFFPAKNLGAYGDGGMVITNDDDVADRVRLLRGHGARTSYYHTMHGFNSRLDAVQAAVLRVKLRYLDRWNAMRLANTMLYNELIGKIDGIEPMYFDDRCVSSCNYYTIRITHGGIDRQRLREHLDSHGIQTNIYYPLSLHLQEVYKDLGYKRGDFPESERAQDHVLSLPMYPELRNEEIREVAAEIGRFVRG